MYFEFAFQFWCLLFYPPVGPPPVQIVNMRPLLVYPRASNFVISLFWVMYVVLTYQHTMFEVRLEMKTPHSVRQGGKVPRKTIQIYETYMYTAHYLIHLCITVQFQVANVFNTILGFGSLCLHLLYALNPTQ